MMLFRKILVSVKFVSAILGPEMGAPILWTRGKMPSFCRKNHVRKIPLFGGGGVWGGGGGECRFYFYGRADFSELCSNSETLRTGRSRGGLCANCVPNRRKNCVSYIKGRVTLSQSRHKVEKSFGGQLYANTPFQRHLLRSSE